MRGKKAILFCFNDPNSKSMGQKKNAHSSAPIIMGADSFFLSPVKLPVCVSKTWEIHAVLSSCILSVQYLLLPLAAQRWQEDIVSIMSSACSSEMISCRQEGIIGFEYIFSNKCHHKWLHRKSYIKTPIIPSKVPKQSKVLELQSYFRNRQ